MWTWSNARILYEVRDQKEAMSIAAQHLRTTGCSLMNEPSYETALIKVREDIIAAHKRAWRRISEAGTWWTGEQRVAIAAEARNALSCSLCRERKAVVSPSAVKGDHNSLGFVPESLVEVIHRIRTDPGRLTKRWYQQVLASGISDAQYVEIISVVATIVAVDTFARGIGVPAPELPVPVDGEHSRIRPASAKLEGAWVTMIALNDATGPLADLYAPEYASNIQRALSLVPNEVRGLSDPVAPHYFPFEKVVDVSHARSISRSQMELLAGRVSALNKCFY